jgi:hypothetical protein
MMPQGAYGCEIDIRVYGVAVGDAEGFSLGFVGASEGQLAEQRFLSTSTARELDDGSFSIAELPVVFFEDVGPSEVADAPAILRATGAPRVASSSTAAGPTHVSFASAGECPQPTRSPTWTIRGNDRAGIEIRRSLAAMIDASLLSDSVDAVNFLRVGDLPRASRPC